MAVGIECKNVIKRYGPQTVLSGVDWSVDAGAIAGLVGASGAGKTTLLRIMAGLESCCSGSVTVGGASQNGGGRHCCVGMVFQNLGLWPHLTVRQHVECVLGSMARSGRKRHAEKLLDEVQVSRICFDRRPAEISGGEAQRVALARALAADPELLLLDEPLAQVDVPLRADLIELVRRVAGDRDVTVVYVSHSCLEVMELCKRIAVLVDGRIAQEGPLNEVFRRPATPVVARLTGPVVEIPGWVLDGKHLDCRVERGQSPAVEGDADHAVLARPQQLRIVEPQGGNCWRVADCRPYHVGWLLELRLAAGGPNECQLRVISVQAPGTGELVGLALDG